MKDHVFYIYFWLIAGSVLVIIVATIETANAYKVTQGLQQCLIGNNILWQKECK
jgi:hypothetical protein